MSIPSPSKAELLQWTYVTLICIAVAFTTLTGASASPRALTAQPQLPTEPWGACLVPERNEAPFPKPVCEPR